MNHPLEAWVQLDIEQKKLEKRIKEIKQEKEALEIPIRYPGSTEVHVSKRLYIVRTVEYTRVSHSIKTKDWPYFELGVSEVRKLSRPLASRIGGCVTTNTSDISYVDCEEMR